MQPAHLQRARGIWWRKIHTVCLDDQLWDGQINEVVWVKGIAGATYKMVLRVMSPKRTRRCCFSKAHKKVWRSSYENHKSQDAG